MLGSAVFFLAGGTMMFFMTKPMVFDKIRGCYWKGRKKPDAVSARQRPGCCARLDEIHALQLLPKIATDGRIDSIYELNLVLTEGGRIHLTDQRNLGAAREYAETLSRFLERPVWDATQ
jgi:hypothetical protein